MVVMTLSLIYVHTHIHTYIQCTWGQFHTYRISGIVCERKHSRCVNCHSVREKMFANLVNQLNFLVINTRKCLRMNQDSQNP